MSRAPRLRFAVRCVIIETDNRFSAETNGGYVMKKLLLAVVILTLMLSSCHKDTKPDDNSKSDTAASATASIEPEIVFTEAEPFLLEGEQVYENWAYTFIDMDNNNIAERISFTNITKDEADSPMTTRLAIEFDFANKNSRHEPVYIEREGGVIVHPEIYCANAEDCTVIFVKDPYAAHGEELYPFKYTSDGILTEFNQETPKRFPDNALSKSSMLRLTDARIVKSDNGNKKMTIILGKHKFDFSFMTDTYSDLCSEYKFMPEQKNIIINFEPNSQTVIYGLCGILTGYDSGTSSLNAISVQALVTLKCSSGAFVITDVNFIEQT